MLSAIIYLHSKVRLVGVSSVCSWILHLRSRLRLAKKFATICSKCSQSSDVLLVARSHIPWACEKVNLRASHRHRGQRTLRGIYNPNLKFENVSSTVFFKNSILGFSRTRTLRGHSQLISVGHFDFQDFYPPPSANGNACKKLYTPQLKSAT